MAAVGNPAFVHYCETIFELAEDDVDVIQARIAERLSVSRPAVSEMIRRLDSEGLVSISAGSRIALTKAGLRLAEAAVRRHRLAERFLTDVLGLSWADAHREASTWEAIISDVTEPALVRLLGDPTTCPHGNPIPGSSYAEPNAKPLSGLTAGDAFDVVRIPEELEFAPGMLDYLESVDLTPGRSGKVLAVAPDGSVTFDIGGKIAGVGGFAASRVLVS